VSPEEGVDLPLGLATDVRGSDVIEWLYRPLFCLLLLVELEPLRTGALGGRGLVLLLNHPLLVLRIQLLVLLYLLVDLRCEQ